MKNATRYTLILLSLLVLFSLACSELEEVKDDLPRFGDALLIGEALESAVCKSQGGTWHKSTNTCK